MTEPLVSLTLTAYNRPVQIRACLESFWMTNDYPNIELIVVDNGSTDQEVRDYLSSLQPPCERYQLMRRDDNDYPVGQKTSRVIARDAARGEYIIDCPDDHLFVVDGDWIRGCIEQIRATHASDDPLVHRAGCIVHYAQPLYRFAKSNNEMIISQVDDDYYESLHKGYADYHIMSRETYEDMGPFKPELGRGCEGEYMKRSHEMGYRRNLMKWPVAIINEGPWELVRPLTQKDVLNAYGTATRPLSNEELTRLAIELGAIRAPGTDVKQVSQRVTSDDEELNEWLES